MGIVVEPSACYQHSRPREEPPKPDKEVGAEESPESTPEVAKEDAYEDLDRGKGGRGLAAQKENHSQHVARRHGREGNSENAEAGGCAQ